MATNVILGGSDQSANFKNSDNDASYHLGIDIGTTTVKVCLIDSSGRIVDTERMTHPQHDDPSATNGHSEQDTRTIFESLKNCMRDLSKDALEKVTTIGICGQMHGVCLWNYDTLEGVTSCSKLVTWMDQRCDPHFLSTLPKPDSHLTLSTGHGCATLFWLQRNTPGILAQYNSSGTIMDLLVVTLCDLKHPVMSTQNAASWGYFNCLTNAFNTPILQSAGFPTHLLPEVATPGTIAGKLQKSWFGIKAGTIVGVALGDLQCSVYSAISSTSSGNVTSREAFVNVSTSAQIAYVAAEIGSERERYRGIEYFPYFDATYLAVGASLNGGNVLATFVNSIQNFLKLFGQTVENDVIWTKLLDAGMAVTGTTLQMSPLLFGERRSPSSRAAIYNLSATNHTVGDLTRAVCGGLIQNLAQFVSEEELIQRGIQTIVATGSALLRNPILQAELTAKFQNLKTKLVSENVDAAVGVAQYTRIVNQN